MRKRSLNSALYPVLFILASIACQKPSHVNGASSLAEIPLVLSVSLSDTLPAKALTDADLPDVKGIKVQYADGKYASYFDYHGDRQRVMAVIASLPFSKGSEIADTSCRNISAEILHVQQQGLPVSEIGYAEFFWSGSGNREAFECLKPPYKHTLLFDKNSTRIFHRIELAG